MKTLLAFADQRIVADVVGTMRICSNCGHCGVTEPKRGGYLALEIVLWLLFVVPGLLYSIYRSSAAGDACKECGSTETLWPGTPRGEELMARYGHSVPLPIPTFRQRAAFLLKWPLGILVGTLILWLLSS